MNATLIYNPVAGQGGSKEQIFQVVEELEEKGWTVSVRETTLEVTAQQLAEQARDEGAEMVIAAGGDGTINNVINGLVHSDVVLGILPTGTANVWAQESGIHDGLLLGTRLQQATKVLVEGTRLRTDVGKANDRYFLLMAGIGLDGIVTASIDKTIKKRLGAFAYAWTAIREGLNFRGAQARIRLDGREMVRRVWLITVSNSKNYALLPLATEASVTDGLLNVGIFEGNNWQHYLRQIISILFRRQNYQPDVEFLHAQQITIESVPPLPVHVDAEPMGKTPMTFEVVPQALTIIVSREHAESLSRPLE